MGAWDCYVLTNDSALDMMDELADSEDIKKDVYKILHGEYPNMHEFLLAVEIVDISLNGIDKDILGGFYDYEKWFKNIEKAPMEELRNDAIHVIKFIQETEEKENYWVDNIQEERKELLKRIEKRLIQAKIGTQI